MQKTYQLKISDKQQKLFNVWAGLEANPNLL
jgi:endonuclease I